MKWIEIIELRTMSSDRILLESQLQSLINNVKQESKITAIKIYKNLSVETDISIHLIFSSGNIESGGSPLGMRLASAIKEFGLVRHSTWIEANLE